MKRTKVYGRKQTICFFFLLIVLFLLSLAAARWWFLFTAVIIGPKDRCGVPSTSAEIAGSRISVPSCLISWMDRDKIDVQRNLKERGFELKKSNSNGNCQHTSVYIAAFRFLLKYIHHLPHFCEIYFNFYSLHLWQDRLLQENCIRSFIVDESVTSFWQKSSADPDAQWMQDLVQLVDVRLKASTITSSKCYKSSAILAAKGESLNSTSGELDRWQEKAQTHRESKVIAGALHGWFLHPVDAIMLSSSVLQEDPCAPIPSHFLSSLQVLILDRRVGRRFTRPDAIYTHLSGSSYVTSVSHTMFEGGPGSLVHQARKLRSVNVLVATHGAGNTNIAFMRPCSIFVEYFPDLFYIPQYFGALAKQSGLLHFPIQISANGSHYRSPLLQQCEDSFARITASVPTRALANDACFKDAVCRKCARGVDSIEVNVDVLGNVLVEALHKRRECIQRSPYYKELNKIAVSAQAPRALSSGQSVSSGG